MDMPAQDTEWTARMARALPEDGKRYEVLDGELFVTPAPGADHQEAIASLQARMRDYVHGNRLGHVFVSPADIEFSPRRLVQPDLFVAPLVDGRRPRTWSDIRFLILAVEVLSPGTARADRQRKRIIYQSQRVPEYWIVDLDSRLIERWRPDDDRPEVLAERLSWQPRPDLEALEIDLEAYFKEVLD